MKRILTVITALMVVCAMSFTVIGDYSHAAGKTKIGAAKAKTIALKNAKLKNGQYKKMEVDFDSDDGMYEVEFTKKNTGSEFDYEINAYSGKIMKKSVDLRYRATTSQKKIGTTKARKSVAKFMKVNYSLVKKGTCKFQKKNRGSKYEIKFRNGKYACECEVLARNGQIIEYEYRYIGR